MTPLPLTVIGGYLGAGKTTLINRLLMADHGLRLAVLVNDFGAINLDAALLNSASEDTIELSNGCVCCTMSGDLFFAIGDMLDRDPRPDHLIVEASGIANPSRIAAVSLAEPDLAYAGIVTLIDGLNIATQLEDPLISAQVREQISAADLLVVSKVSPDAPTISSSLRALETRTSVGSDDLDVIMAMVFEKAPSRTARPNQASTHPDYVQWSIQEPAAESKQSLSDRLERRPSGLLRLKALVPDLDRGYWEIHVVGSHHSIIPRDTATTTGLVAIGPKGAVTTMEISDWWSRA